MRRYFYEDNSSSGLWTFGEADWNPIGGKYEAK